MSVSNCFKGWSNELIWLIANQFFALLLFFDWDLKWFNMIWGKFFPNFFPIESEICQTFYLRIIFCFFKYREEKP